MAASDEVNRVEGKRRAKEDKREKRKERESRRTTVTVYCAML